MAQAACNAGLRHRFKEQAMIGNTRSLLNERGLDGLPGIQQFLFTLAKAETVTPRRQTMSTERLAPPRQQDLRHRVEFQRFRTDRVPKHGTRGAGTQTGRGTAATAKDSAPTSDRRTRGQLGSNQGNS
jgi:hypothetical protein